MSENSSASPVQEDRHGRKITTEEKIYHRESKTGIHRKGISLRYHEGYY